MRKKYALNAGYTLTEQKEWDKLSDLARKGFLVEKFTFGGFFYQLQKTAPENIVYTLDCFTGQKEDLPEYLEVCKDAGWEFVCSQNEGKAGIYLLFKGSPETKPLYSDSVTYAENYKAQAGSYFWYYALPALAISLVLVMGGLLLFTGVLSLVAFLIGGIVFLYALNMASASLMFLNRAKKAPRSHQEKKNLSPTTRQELNSRIGEFGMVFVMYFMIDANVDIIFGLNLHQFAAIGLFYCWLKVIVLFIRESEERLEKVHSQAMKFLFHLMGIAIYIGIWYLISIGG